MPVPLPEQRREFACEVVRTLRQAGYEALWAGGCVRDQLLNLVPKDYDVATSARPEEVRGVFGKRRTLPIGAAFGVITVLGPRSVGQIEVATFRTDSTYSDGRHPDSVSYSDAQHDALRRDFTINGLFFDPLTEKLMDYVGGEKDLADRVVRAIGDPVARFGEDKLRMLRAVRFAATFGFRIEPATFAAIERLAAGINQVSAERIGMEIRRMLLDPHRREALRLLKESHLLVEVLPELDALPAGAWRAVLETLHTLGPLPTDYFAVALAALFHTSGSSADLRAVGRRLRLTNQETDSACWLLEHLPIVAEARSAPWPQLQRVLIHPLAVQLLVLLAAIPGRNQEALNYCGEKLRLPAEVLNPAPLLAGADLIAHGLDPSPAFSKLLDRVRDAQLEGVVTDRKAALAMVDHLLAQGLDE